MTDLLVIDRPGVYDLTDADYHRDPVPGGSLSSTGARKLLPPGCPARYHHDRGATASSTPTFDLGKAAHLRVLGAGPELVIVDAVDWRTKAAQEARKAARDQGKVPVLAHQVKQVDAMADAIRGHPVASQLLDPRTGAPELSLFWIDQATGVWLRARLDFLRNRTTGRVLIVDYKTTESASLEHIERAIYAYGYHQQAAMYLDGVRALGLADDPAFVFVFQETSAPYLITAVQLTAFAEGIGRRRNREAIDIYRECTETGHWPGHAEDIQLVSLPAWVERNHKEIA
ncbi:PD-(D/E)XK nuclease-like domain-containing protein [Micromonospora chalcea]|uniref:PD-(D/E)XK nuclease-like domain-containing protein n=1 Tax=Micromonospora chalcea TaxID=1874 RepID=UPI003D749CC0